MSYDDKVLGLFNASFLEARGAQPITPVTHECVECGRTWLGISPEPVKGTIKDRCAECIRSHEECYRED